ncbi:MAG: sensor histidine kinase [Anaerolineae bacterium]|nr:sensor histidine kinase [Anaerolineae bacterium]
MDDWDVILNGDLDLENLASILTPWQPLWNPAVARAPVHLDLRGVTFVWPSAITLLTAAILLLRQRGFEVRITPPDLEKVHSYLARIDFYALVDFEADYPWPRYDSSGRFREVVQANSEAEGETVVGEVLEILGRNLAGIGPVYDAVQYAFLEVVNNVFHHAHSPIQAIICAQSYPQLHRVELAVVDGGRGIPASLEGNPKLSGRFSTAAEAIQLAVQPRITGRPEYNTGEGLFFTLEFIKANGGDACIHSQDGRLWVQGDQATPQLAPLWPGTLVALRFWTDRPVVTKTIFNRHAPPEEDFDWLFEEENA